MEAVGLNIQLNGEADFTRSIANITAKSKELASELKMVTSAYGDNDKKLEVLGKQVENQTKYIDALNKKYDSQKSHLDDLGKELAAAKEKYGDGFSWINTNGGGVSMAQSNLLDKTIDDIIDEFSILCADDYFGTTYRQREAYYKKIGYTPDLTLHPVLGRRK